MAGLFGWGNKLLIYKKKYDMKKIYYIVDCDGFFMEAFSTIKKAQKFIEKSNLKDQEIHEAEVNPKPYSPIKKLAKSEDAFMGKPDISNFLLFDFPKYTFAELFYKVGELKNK